MGCHLSDRCRPGRARGPRLPGALPPGGLPPARRRPRPHRDDPPRAHPGRRRAHRAPRRRSLPGPVRDDGDPPLFGVEIPVVAHHAAEIDKGAGIAMCCTFGDLTDVLWWRELRLPTRSIITRAGRLQAETPEWLAGGPGEQLYADQVAGATAFRAREAIVSALRPPATSTASPPRPSARRTSTNAARSRWRSSPRASGTSATADATPTSTPPSSSAAGS